MSWQFSGGGSSSAGGGATPSTGGAAIIDTAGQGYFMSDGRLTSQGFAGNASVSAANQVRAAQFVLPVKITITKISIDVTTANPAATIGIAIYDAAGTTRLLQSGAFDGSTTGVKTATIGAVTLNPGVYWFAYAHSDATVQETVFIAPGTNNAALLGARYGSSANAFASPNMPASLGVVTNLNFAVAMALFEA
jgi:hypothetical protein